MVYKGLFCLVFLFHITFVSFSHVFYVSVCSVIKDDNTLQLSLKVFKNDLFDVLNIRKKTLATKEEKIILDYVKKNLLLELNGFKKSLFLNKISFEGNDYTESLNIKLYVKNANAFSSIKIKNTLLLEGFEEQINIVYLNFNDERKTLSFNKVITENSYSFSLPVR